MARKKTASAATARKTIKAPARGAAALIETTAASLAPAQSASRHSPRPQVQAAPKGLEDLVAAGQDNLDACVTYGSIVFKGLETLGNEVITLTQASVEANFAATRSLLAAKTLDEVVEVQTGFARDRLEGFASETAKIGALTMDVANQALEPLRSRFDATARSVFRPFGL